MEKATTLADRIAHAEGWLGRASQQIRDGQPERGALALLLAEAELHRARQVGFAGTAGARTGARQGSWGPLLAVAALATAALVTGLLAFSQPGVVVEAHGAVLPVLRLQAGDGEMLWAVTVPEPPVQRTTVVERTVIRRVPAYHPVPAVRPSGVAVSAAGAAPTPPRTAPAAVPSPAPAAPAAAPASPAQARSLLSDADVIELVLAAERSLRRSDKE
jgi:hypothetical protein